MSCSPCTTIVAPAACSSRTRLGWMTSSIVRWPTPAVRQYVDGARVAPSRTSRNAGVRGRGRPRRPTARRRGEASRIAAGRRPASAAGGKVVGDEGVRVGTSAARPGASGCGSRRVDASAPSSAASTGRASGVAAVGVAAVAVGAVAVGAVPPSVPSAVAVGAVGVAVHRDGDGVAELPLGLDVVVGDAHGADHTPRRREPGGRGAALRSRADGRHARAAPPRRERLEPEEPVHRLGRRRPHRQGRGRGARGGELLVEHDLLPDVVHTSLQRRAIRTAELALAVGRSDVDPGAPLVAAQRAPLRRAAGQGQGADARRVGEEQFMLLAPLLRHAAAAAARRRRCSQFHDPRYAALPPEVRPRTECLADVVARMLPYWYDAIVPDLRPARPCSSPPTATACGRSIKHLDGMSRGGRRRAQRADRHPAALRPRRRAAPGHARRRRTSIRTPRQRPSRRSRTRASADRSPRRVTSWRRVRAIA